MSKPIICIKLITGEELIAKITDPAEVLLGTHKPAEEAFKDDGKTTTWHVQGSYVLEDILSIAVQPTNSGAMALALIPWMMGNHEAPMLLNFDRHVMCVFAPRKEVTNAYLTQTSGISLATTSPAVKNLSSKLKLS